MQGEEWTFTEQVILLQGTDYIKCMVLCKRIRGEIHVYKLLLEMLYVRVILPLELGTVKLLDDSKIMCEN